MEKPPIPVILLVSVIGIFSILAATNIHISSSPDDTISFWVENAVMNCNDKKYPMQQYGVMLYDESAVQTIYPPISNLPDQGTANTLILNTVGNTYNPLFKAIFTEGNVANNQFEIKGTVYESACTDEFITPYSIEATGDCNVAGTSFTLKPVTEYGVSVTLTNVITACTS